MSYNQNTHKAFRDSARAAKAALLKASAQQEDVRWTAGQYIRSLEMLHEYEARELKRARTEYENLERTVRLDELARKLSAPEKKYEWVPCPGGYKHVEI